MRTVQAAKEALQEALNGADNDVAAARALARVASRFDAEVDTSWDTFRFGAEQLLAPYFDGDAKPTVWAILDLARNGLSFSSQVGGHVEAGCREPICADSEPADPESGEADLRRSPRCSAVGVFMSDVEPEDVRWLWPRRIPLGKLTVLDGDPEMLKSTLLLDVSARLSRGKPMPDGSKSAVNGPAGTVLLTAEDGFRDTVRPRLDAAGANASRIVALEGVRTEPNGEALVPTVEDVDAIEELVRAVDARLIVVDPLTAYIGRDTNTHNDADIRRALVGLAKLADRLGVAVVAIRHLTKGEKHNPKYAGGGSIAIIAAARSGLLVAENPNAPERSRVLACTKANLCASPPSLVFRPEPADNSRVRIVWEGESDYSAADLLERPTGEERSALAEAKDFLQLALGVQLTRDGFGGPWVWSLPESPKGEDSATFGNSTSREPSHSKGHSIDGQPENEVGHLRQNAESNDGQERTGDGHLRETPGDGPPSGGDESRRWPNSEGQGDLPLEPDRLEGELDDLVDDLGEVAAQ